ncbi:MAG: hypothetical protein ACI9VS_001736, partial [Candidatus Binatia bacterium]
GVLRDSQHDEIGRRGRGGSGARRKDGQRRKESQKCSHVHPRLRAEASDFNASADKRPVLASWSAVQILRIDHSIESERARFNIERNRQAEGFSAISRGLIP